MSDKNSGIINTNITAGRDITNVVIHENSHNKQSPELLQAFDALFAALRETGIDKDKELNYIKSSLEEDEPDKSMISMMLGAVAFGLEKAGKLSDFITNNADSLSIISSWFGDADLTSVSALFGS